MYKTCYARYGKISLTKKVRSRYSQALSTTLDIDFQQNSDTDLSILLSSNAMTIPGNPKLSIDDLDFLFDGGEFLFDDSLFWAQRTSDCVLL